MGNQGSWGTCVAHAVTRVMQDLMKLKYNKTLHEQHCLAFLEQHCLAGIQPDRIITLFNQAIPRQAIPDSDLVERFEMELECQPLLTFEEMRLEVMTAPGYHHVVAVIQTDVSSHTLHAVAALTTAPSDAMVVH